MQPYNQRSDDEVKKLIKAMFDRCQGFPDDESAKKELGRLIRTELDYHDWIDIDCTSQQRGGLTHRTFKVKMLGPSGKLLQI